MRVTVYINNKGTVCSAGNLNTKRLPPIRIDKQSRKLKISITRKVSVQALLSLIAHIRLFKDLPIELHSEFEPLQSTVFEQPILCYLHIGQACLFQFEQNYPDRFLSHITFWEEQRDETDHLPFEMVNLSKIKLHHLDTPTALSNITQNQTTNAAFFRFTADQHLSLVKSPENIVYPNIEEENQTKLPEGIEHDTYLQWLLIAGQIAIATGQCLYQFGHIYIKSNTDMSMHPFIKLLLPIASPMNVPKITA